MGAMGRSSQHGCEDIPVGASKELQASRRLNIFLAGLVLLSLVFQSGSPREEGTTAPAISETDDEPHPSRRSSMLEASEARLVASKRLYILGERNSGTNYLEKVLKQSYFPNFSDQINLSSKGRSELERKLQARWKEKHPYAYGSPVFEFKHMFRSSFLSEQEIAQIKADEDSLWIFAIRSPCEWADAMYRKPWHLCPMNSTLGCKEVGNRSRVQFLRSPWNDHVEANLSRDNYTMYSNVFELRSFKLRLMEQVAMVAPHRVYVAHLNQVEKSPRAFIDALTKLHGLIPTRLFSKNSQSPIQHGPVCFDPDEYRTAMRHLDWDLEGFFGFSPLDCHVCSVK